MTQFKLRFFPRGESEIVFVDMIFSPADSGKTMSIGSARGAWPSQFALGTGFCVVGPVILYNNALDYHNISSGEIIYGSFIFRDMWNSPRITICTQSVTMSPSIQYRAQFLLDVRATH